MLVHYLFHPHNQHHSLSERMGSSSDRTAILFVELTKLFRSR